jgi:hypothetical protein
MSGRTGAALLLTSRCCTASYGAPTRVPARDQVGVDVGGSGDEFAHVTDALPHPHLAHLSEQVVRVFASEVHPSLVSA